MAGALVAGGTGALGGAVVEELTAAGWAVTVVDRQPHAHRGRELRARPTCSTPEAARGAVEAVADLRAVVNLVGGFSMGPKVEGAELADFERMLRLNLVPAFNLAHAAMPRLAAGEGGGAFVAVSARAALQPFSGAAGYITAKAGVLAFVKALDAEYRDGGRALQRRDAERHRHACKPGVHAGRRLVEVGPAAADRAGHPLPLLRGLGAHVRRGRTGVRPRLSEGSSGALRASWWTACRRRGRSPSPGLPA